MDVVAVHACRLFAVFYVYMYMRLASVFAAYSAAGVTNSMRCEYAGQFDREAAKAQRVEGSVTASETLLQCGVRKRKRICLEFATAQQRPTGFEKAGCYGQFRIG